MKSWTKVLLWIIVVGLVGGGTYYAVNKKATTDKNNLQAQIDDLNTKLTAAQKSLSATQTTSTIAAASATVNWQTYTDPTLNFTFKYPADFLFNDTVKGGTSGKSDLHVSVSKLSTYTDEPMGYDKAGATARQSALTNASFPVGNPLGQPVKASERVVKISNNAYTAADQMILREIDASDVQLVRETYFYANGYEVNIKSSAGDPLGVIPAKYLTADNTWGDSDGFYAAISTNKLSGNLQNWYNNYDLMIQSIKF